MIPINGPQTNASFWNTLFTYVGMTANWENGQEITNIMARDAMLAIIHLVRGSTLAGGGKIGKLGGSDQASDLDNGPDKQTARQSHGAA